MTKSRNSKVVYELVREHYSNPHIIESYMTVGLWPSEEKMIDSFFRPGTSVLDIGCGAGRTSIALVEKGYEVTGIDLLPGMIEAAEIQAKSHNVKVNFKVMDAVNLDFPDESFNNAIFSFNGFEQIPGKKNREKVLRRVWELLKSDGCFIITARSGLAIGRRSIAWVLMSLRFFYQQLRNGSKQNLEFGDKIWKDEYHHYVNPFKLKSLVQRIGYKLIYFNSSKNVEKERPPTLFTNFTNDKALFYVLKKCQKNT